MPTTLVAGVFTPPVLLAVARRTGKLAEHDLDVTEERVPSSPEQFRGLIDGTLDVAFTSPDNVLAYRFGPDNPLGTAADARIVTGVDRGLGLALYGRPGFGGPESLRGAVLGVDVPTSGFALAMYALIESLGVDREAYEVVALGSTPRRLEALLAGECDATMLNAGNELLAEDAGCAQLARVVDVCSPYLGTVLAVVGKANLAGASALGQALLETARDVLAGRLDDEAREEAMAVLGLSGELATRYVARLKDRDEGLVAEGELDLAALNVVSTLRHRHLGSELRK